MTINSFLQEEQERFEKEIPTAFFFENGDWHKRTPVVGGEIIKSWIKSHDQRLLDKIAEAIKGMKVEANDPMDKEAVEKAEIANDVLMKSVKEKLLTLLNPIEK